MVKLNRAEIWIVLVTALFLVFVGGYFLGQHRESETVTVQKESGVETQMEASTSEAVSETDGLTERMTSLLSSTGAEKAIRWSETDDDEELSQSESDDSKETLDSEPSDGKVVPWSETEEGKVVPWSEREEDELPPWLVVIDGEIRHKSEVIENDAKRSSDSSAPNEKLDLNTATQEELQELPDIGESRASAILAYRAENGQFYAVEELLAVDGIGEKRYEAICDYVTVQ